MDHDNQIRSVDQQPAHPHHRHRASLEGVFLASPQEISWSAAESLSAARCFNKLIGHFDTPLHNAAGRYNRTKLVGLTYEYARSDTSKTLFLKEFFDFTQIPIDGSRLELEVVTEEAVLRESLFEFADFLFQNFFFPLKASGNTPQPTPASMSALQRLQQDQGDMAALGTTERLADLRGLCLQRDKYCCVVTRNFDRSVALGRLKKAIQEDKTAVDDEGNALDGRMDGFASLEIAHILPHSLTQLEPDGSLAPAKKIALSILNMFDSNVVHGIDGPNIDRPANAISLSQDIHSRFGMFDIFFEPAGDDHTYRIDTFHPIVYSGKLPVTRTLHLSENHTIEPPSPRYLAIHAAIARILHLSAAGECIDHILRDYDHNGIRGDGSTDLAALIQLRLDGWAVPAH